MTPTTITIHNTDNTNSDAGAKAHSRFVRNTGYYVLNGRKNPVSWHFTVDDTFIIQHLPLDEVAFHAGSQANASSIAIEICMNPDSDEAGANARAAALAARLIAGLGLGIGALRRHRDWTGKNCPSRLLTASKWNAFVASVQAELRDSGLATAAAALGDEAADAPPVHAPTLAEDYQIDHAAVAAALDAEASAAWFGDEGGSDPADVLRRVADGLAGAASAEGPRLLFPYGITEIALTLPAGISLTVKGPAEGRAVEVPSPRAVEPAEDETACAAPDDGEGEAVALADPIDTPLPASTATFYAYGSANKRFGTARTIRAIEVIAAAYFAETGVRLGIGNLSLRGGGAIPPHSSHRKGVDVDIRVPRRDAREDPATWQDQAYSRTRTQRLVHLVRANAVMPVRTILFNDGQVSGVRPWAGHDNHLHVSFSAAQAGAALNEAGADAGDDAAPGTRLPETLRPFAAVRAGGELDDTLDAYGFAKVLVSLAPDGRAGLAAAAVAPGAVDAAFAACFEIPDQAQAASLAAAAVALSPADEGLPPPPVTVFPRLGVAVGTVSRAKIEHLRRHRLTRGVHPAPEFSPVRPLAVRPAPAPRSVEWGLGRLRVPLAWQAGFDGQGIVVGHLDTGVDAGHPALDGALHSFAEFDLTGRRLDGTRPRDSGRHGTHTAGIIAGRRVGNRGQIGVAPGCRIASALVIEGGDVITRILGGLEWIVEQNARILNLSLGLRGYTTAFQVVIDALWDNDVLPVIAVGNEYANSSRSPGNYPTVLSIGAMGQDEHVAAFSSSQRFDRLIEPLVPDLVAPGVDVLSCVPGGGYEKLSGSSMATPHVAGLAAILRQADPAVGARGIEEAILASCLRPASMLQARANRGVPDAVRALRHLGVSVPEAGTAAKSTRSRAAKRAVAAQTG